MHSIKRWLCAALVASLCALAAPASAAITFTELTSGNDTNAGSANSFTTASVTLASDKCYLLAFTNSKAASVDAASTVTSTGATWTLVVSVTNPGADTRLTVYRGVGSGTGGITVDFGAVETGWAWKVEEVDGADETASCANMIVQQPTNVGSSTTPSVTMSALSDASNAEFLTASAKVSTTWAPEAGWTELGSETQQTNPNVVLGASYLVAQDTSATATIGTSGAWQAIALEIKTGTAAAPARGRVVGGGFQ